jgi:DNA-binding NarL/FixJ family response regulator
MDSPQRTPPEISVIVLSGDRLFSEAVGTVLAGEADLRVRRGLQERELDAPDVVVIDTTLDEEAALARTAALRESLAAQVIVVGLEREDERIIDFIEAGASGYVLRTSPPAGLVAAIRAVHRGETLCSPRVASGVRERIARIARPPERPLPGVALTEREAHILRLMAAGLRNKEIGRSLQITAQTVKNHVHKILEKLGVHSRRRAVRVASESGLL